MRDDNCLQFLLGLLSKQSMDLSALKPGDDHAYDALAEAAKAGVSELLTPFKTVASAEELLKTMSIEQFFQKFLIHADRFTATCCDQYAAIMRQCAVVSEVKGTPTLALAKEIRSQVFESLDSILIGYIQNLQKIGIDLSIASSELRANSLIDAAMKGAAVGQIAGGFGGSGKAVGAFNALLQAGAEAERRLALMQQRAALLKQAESMALPQIAAYLEQVTKLPERLLDFGCARAFGGQVLLERQRVALQGVMDAIVAELKHAVDITLALPEAERKLEAQIAATETAAKQTNRENNPSSSKMWINPFVGLGIIIVVLVIVGLIINHFYPIE
jgi:hypothetical protein